MLTEMLSLVPAALRLSHASIALHTVKIKNKPPKTWENANITIDYSSFLGEHEPYT